jgi:L-ascorbate metabolism protein UlaG (beta-lactamase superfamily)
MKLTYLGHSAFLLNTLGKTILFDPFITPNPKAAHIDVTTLNPDYILISHAHSDHIADLVTIAHQSNAKVIANWEIIQWCAAQGLTNLHPMNTGGKFSFDIGTVHATIAQHSSSFADGTYGGNPMGFVIQNQESTLYYAGDTALTLDMQILAKKFAINTAILPLGDNFTMDYNDAIMAASYINCSNIIGMHFDTFDMIAIDHDAAIQGFEQAGKSLFLPSIGQSFDI